MAVENKTLSGGDFMMLDCHHKIVYDNVRENMATYNSLHNYFTTQMMSMETQNTECTDPNIIEVHCLDDFTDCDVSKKMPGLSTNNTYEIDRFIVKGKNTCTIEKKIINMNIGIKYKIRDGHSLGTELPTYVNVEYIIKTDSDQCNQTVITNKDVSKHSKMVFYPKNKLSFKFFDLFISSLLVFNKKKNTNHYITDAKELTIYINDDSYWQELFNRPTRDIDSVYLPIETKERVINDLEWFIKNETQLRYEQLGRNYKRVVLFEGIPGSGKTSFALSLASHFNYDLAILSFTDKVTDGTFTRLIRQMPENTILLLEDIDCLFHERKSEDTQKNFVTFSGILNTLDGIATPHKFICIITTNYKNMLDDALLRPGRVDNIVSFDYIKRQQIHDIYKTYMGELYSSELFKTFYKEYSRSGISLECSASLIQEYLFKYLDNPIGALENIGYIKELKQKCTKTKPDVYM